MGDDLSLPHAGGSAHPHQCPLEVGSRLHLLLHADVRTFR